MFASHHKSVRIALTTLDFMFTIMNYIVLHHFNDCTLITWFCLHAMLLISMCFIL